MNRLQIRTAIIFLSFLLMSVTFVYISPLVMMMGLSQGVIAAALIFWITVFLLTFIFGRAFCGYLCPMGAEQELFDKAVRTKLRRIPYLRYLKFLLAALWVGGAVVLAAGAGSLAVKPLFGLGNGLPPWNAGAYLFLYGMTLGVLVLALIFGRRGMCTYFCPMSVVFMVITHIKNRIRIPSLHLEADPEKCIRCKKCEAACPMSLPVQEMAENNEFWNPECIVCGSCADVCPKNVIRLAWFWKK